MSFDLAGIYPAFLTPLDGSRRVAPKVVSALLCHLLQAGVDGVYVAGSTGEGLKLPIEERELLVEIIASTLPQGKKLMVHIGAANLKDALHLAHHAAQHGAHAISSLPLVADAAGVREYYRVLAQEGELPLIVYYFPRAVPTAFQNPQELLEICDLPQVLGVKFTDFNLHFLQQIVKRGKLVFNGYDEVLAAGLLMGAQGGIGSTYNVMPQVYLEIYRAAQRGDWETARQWQARSNAVLDVLLRHPFFPALRAMMAHRGFDCGPMMSREDFASAADRARFLRDLEQVMPAEVAEHIDWPMPATGSPLSS